MKAAVDPKETSRAAAFAFWMKAPNPMVTFFRTLDVTHLVRVSKRRRLRFNMLMAYCVGRAKVSIPEFYLLPVAAGSWSGMTLSRSTRS